MNIREAEVTDAEKLAGLIQKVDETSQFMLFEPGERQVSVERQSEMIKKVKQSANSTIFVAEQNNVLVGYLFAIGGNARRNKHSVYIVIGISEEFRGMGIGGLLFEALDEWAEKIGIHRLELTVATENKAGIRLYEKAGFQVEGIKRNSLFIDGEYVDEYYMSKLIDLN